MDAFGQDEDVQDALAILYTGIVAPLICSHFNDLILKFSGIRYSMYPLVI
jgi:hypothetical protein